MRRCVLVVFMWLLPLQMVWAAAAPYCGHEADRAAVPHFGHHEHRHHGADGGAAANSPHADCASCHLGCAATLPSPSVALKAVAVRAPVRQQQAAYFSHIPPGPERPDRAQR